MEPVVPPKSNAKKPWPYNVELYKKRNEVERLFCRIKRFRRIATRYDKLDVIFLGFLLFAFVVARACSLKNIVKGVKVCQNSCMMEISQVQYERIADCFPVHRGNVAYDNLRVLNAILYVMKWV